MATFETKMQVYQSISSGWTAETNRSECGKNWQITTLKRSNGFIVSMAQAVQDEGNGMVSYMVFGNEKDRFQLSKVQAKATEKAVRDAHFEALAIFDAKVQSGELGKAEDVYQVKIGQVLFTEYQHDKVNRRAVYEVCPRGRFKTVLLDGSGFKTDEHVRDFKEVFGIGTYYNQGAVISESDLSELLITTHENVKQADVVKAVQMQLASDHRSAMIEAGAKVLPAFPDSVKAVLIGSLKIDKSDPMTDYFGSETGKVVYLAFSTHNKNLFPEFRKAAANFEDTKFLQDSPESYEHREDYTGGGGYYLGEWRNSGWQVKKNAWLTPDLLVGIQIAIGEGRCFIPFETQEFGKNETLASVDGIEVVDYSDKALAVIGETYPIRQMLKEQGGRFNKFLKVNGQTVAGWIFQKSNPPKFA